ncbi:uncharacterized protein HMPREF1541_04694 [Cyphellophora europaea CBS 101466]|uniref:NADH dehydrogenase [ubiquinone] 1 alpha subcomplex subunit n=1 Tax=Cyphellophora europaea (strain CBS 101466) TaxID=1220924 RepID=W2RVG5_CYPE1|nr:uncharacterized protein HMPREF1541_04694 [Cyphellophora europaea CBS 101466]ETN40417.1 hypothetical protein HMPREF1541_04694 [Cyphellophora europaea CBS 101466]
MSTISRTLRNLRRIGLKQYGIQLHYQGDTKAGTLVGTDRMGNKFYENLTEDLPLRTRWVEYSQKELDASQIDPGWHAWISYLVDKPPSEDKIMQMGLRPWEDHYTRINYTQSRGAYKPYSTTKPKYSAWDPVAKPRDGQSLFQTKDVREGGEYEQRAS